MPILKRGGTYHFRKEVPKRYRHLDPRREVWQSLGTDSLALARERERQVAAELAAYWQALEQGEDATAPARFDAARTLAGARGVPYLTAAELAAGPMGELVRRLERLEAHVGAPGDAVITAELGGVQRPRVMLSAVLDAYFPLVADRLTGKSEDQVRRWRNPRMKAVRNLLSVIGDKAIEDVTRADGLAFRAWWFDRLAAEELRANSANKDLSHLSEIWHTLERLGRYGLGNPFSRLRLAEEAADSPAPFSSAWIRDKLLAPGAFGGLNDQARDIFLAMINTGCRPSEIVDLAPTSIRLEAEVPHIAIEPIGRVLKTAHSRREMPLVGVSLEAIARHPQGFPRYRFKAVSAINLINKYLRNNGLQESDRHSVYSLRHAFEDRLLRVEAPDRVRADLMGHKFGRPRYGAGADLEHKRRWIEKVSEDLAAVSPC